MSVTNNLGDFLTNLANAIRTKKGTSSAINAQSFANEIAAIETGTDTSDATASASDILSGKTAYVNGSKITGTIASKSAATYTPSTANQSIAAGQYLSGAQTISGDSNLVASNIKSGVSIFGVSGTYSVSLPTLNAPSLSISGSTLTITQSANNGNFASGFRVYNGATLIATTSETWVINQSPDLSGSGEILVDIDFSSNGNNYSYIAISQGNQMSREIYYGSVDLNDEAYGPVLGWNDDAYRTVTFETAPTGDLLTWLQANAVKQTPASMQSETTVDLSSYITAVGSYTITAKAYGTNFNDSTASSSVTYTNYSVTNTLANCTSNNSAASVSPGASYSATLTAASGYTLTGATASVTMGGVDITSTAYSAGVITISSVTGAIAITVSAIQSAPMPSVGQLITMNLDGTDRQYRVLKVSGDQAEVVCMSTVGNSTFGANNTYAGSSLDTYLNNTWYNTLTATAKAAIVSKTFDQDSWDWGTNGSPVYSGHYGNTVPGTTSYSISKVSAYYGAQITRNIYALSVQDVIDYITNTAVGDGLLENYNIWKMFWDTTTMPSSSDDPWLRSARAYGTDRGWSVSYSYGSVSYERVSSENAVRPALTIDLSEISWTTQPVGSGAADFATDDWSIVQLEAQRISEMGTAEGSPYSVGDEKDVTLTTGETITLRILGFNHDTKTAGGTAGITFGMKNLLAATYYINSSNTNVGGWGSSNMRSSTMATLYTLLPDEVQTVIKPVNKLTSAGNTSSTINTTSDSLFLLSEIEVFGTLNYSYTGEGSQYAWFAAHNTAAERIKYLSNGTGSAYTWWLRSPRYSYSTSFCVVYASGYANISSADSARGVAFGFCI